MAPQPYQVLVGQNYEGSKVQGVKEIFAKKAVFCGGIGAAGNVPTVALTSNAGTLATITSQLGYDMAGSFVLTAGTASTAAGTVATVVFGDPAAATPVSVVMSAANTTAGATTNLTVGALAVSKTGFSVYAAGAPVVNDTYLVSYMVMRDPH